MSSLNPPIRFAESSLKLSSPRWWAAELLLRERRLTFFASVLLALVIPMLLALAVDERTLRDANVWIKPIKFAVSIALLALTTAWFIGHLPVQKRRGQAITRIVWLLIATGSFEFGYIAMQAALGQASHYNVGDLWHGIMYTLMGIGAIGLTATQPLLAWQLYKHPDLQRPQAYRQAVLLGLVLTFVMGAGVGILLGAMQPPHGGAQVPVFGWSLSGGDLRPAHFVGIHAGQVLPAIGFAAVAMGMHNPLRAIWAFTLIYAALFLTLVAWGLAGLG